MLHETGNTKWVNPAHDPQNLIIFLVCPILFAAYFYERKTYIAAMIYSTCLIFGIHFFQDHINKALWFVLISTMTMATRLAEFLFGSALWARKWALKKKFESEKTASVIASKQKSQLLVNLSHDIRDPFHGLCGMVRLL